MEKNINISYIKEISIYTDGSCLGNPGPGGWCYILTTNERKSKIIDSNGAANTTNNRMELQALLEAMKKIESIITINKDTKITQSDLFLIEAHSLTNTSRNLEWYWKSFNQDKSKRKNNKGS